MPTSIAPTTRSFKRLASLSEQPHGLKDLRGHDPARRLSSLILRLSSAEQSPPLSLEDLRSQRHACKYSQGSHYDDDHGRCGAGISRCPEEGLGMCDLTRERQLTLPMDATASAQARRFLRDSGCLGHNASVLDEAQILVSELVTNAVLHAAPPITMSVTCNEMTAMEVRVRDGSDQQPKPRQPDLLDPSGRGLLLVDIISSAWGVEPTDDGKVVWFLLKSA